LRLRFAVHRPAQWQASPRGHGTPCRDVPGRVHVRVAGVSAGPATEDGLALARLRIDGAARRPNHGSDLQVLNTDHVEAAGQIGGGLPGPVPAPVCLAGRQPGDRGSDTPASIRPPLGASRLPLTTEPAPANTLSTTTEKTREGSAIPLRPEDRSSLARIK
jgi:hypothetical protein